ncbi:hypothetical protein [Collimonas fungivorans]|uniref:hypothetical protein n=1 Tax=Collimonas fungivorans TaxID=158899 RepID=UPI0002F21E47|nr:hypothetical protein [Collimonas fungivorans]
MTSSLSISEALAFAHGQSGPESSIAAAAQDIDMDAILRRSACRDAFNAGSLAYAKARPTPSATATETDSTTLFQQG